jgi:hypothetical protein
MQVYDDTIRATLEEKVRAIEAHFNADVAFYFGEIFPAVIRPFRDFIEKLAADATHERKLALFVNGPGGSAEVVEKMVEILRFHYDHVYFVVPDIALSAATILCMSGDKIFMDYSSSLGPIDPQVFNGKHWVPALGYLDKVDELLAKARAKQLTDAEFVMLQNMDLALLRRYEQSRDLTVSLLQKWLVEYKFKDWTVHRSDPVRKGLPVTLEEKQARARKIAEDLGDNKLWHSHGRMIGAATLSGVLRLEIDDYSRDGTLRPLIRGYNDLLTEYIARQDFKFFLHSRNYF